MPNRMNAYTLRIICQGSVVPPVTLRPNQPLTFGRGEDSDLLLEDRYLSRQQVTIELNDAGEVWARDHRGKNPTLLAGEPITEVQLRAGDTLAAGHSKIILCESKRSASLSSTLAIGSSSDLESSRLTFELSADNPDEFLSKGTGTRSRPAQLKAIARLTETIGQIDSREEVFALVESTLEGKLDFDRYFLALGIPSESNFEIAHVLGPTKTEQVSMSQSILDKIRREQKAVLVEDPVAQIKPTSDSILELGISSFMCAPMVASGEFTGFLYADRLNGDKPFDPGDLHFLQGVAHLTALAFREFAFAEYLKSEDARLHELIDREAGFVANSRVMLEVISRVDRYAKSDAAVLISGETGTGKEHFARMLHTGSPRAEGPFVAFNCALSNPSMIESELFGHVKGAFTGADRDRKGRFQLAEGGTLFLDEIAEMPVDLQAKLLRVLQEKKVWPVGSDDGIPADFRLVSATHQNLKQLRESKQFRDDLYYRISGLYLDVPPLSKRGDDVVEIAESLLGGTHQLSEEACGALKAYSWPGNVRELQNIVEHLRLTAAGKTIRLSDLPPHIRESRRSPFALRLESLKEVEAKHIAHTLKIVKGNKRRAAELLGISRTTLYQKLNQYNL